MSVVVLLSPSEGSQPDLFCHFDTIHQEFNKYSKTLVVTPRSSESHFSFHTPTKQNSISPTIIHHMILSVVWLNAMVTKIRRSENTMYWLPLKNMVTCSIKFSKFMTSIQNWEILLMQWKNINEQLGSIFSTSETYQCTDKISTEMTCEKRYDIDLTLV